MGTSVKIIKPVAILNKTVDLKPTSVFSSLQNLFITQDPIETLTSLLKDSELITRLEEYGWILIWKSILLAIKDLSNKEIFVKELELFNFEKDIESILENTDFEIDKYFFDKPYETKLITQITPIVKNFIESLGVDNITSSNFAARFPYYFITALMGEWRDNREYYKKLETHFSPTPFDAAQEKEEKWKFYSAYLQKQIHEPMFSENFSLAQIYIPLRSYYIEKKDSSDKGLFEETHVIVNLENEIKSWLKKGDKNDSIRMISGGPGIGKSSFLKIMAAKIAEEGNIKTIFIPMHHFELEKDIEDAVNKFINYDINLKGINPFEEKRLLIIFDGLDELAMQGKSLHEAVKSFIDNIKLKTGIYNNTIIRLQILLSGREIVIQSNENKFKEKEILHILPYYWNDQRKNVNYNDANNLLWQDQRDEWWQKYGELKGKPYKELPYELKIKDLNEVTVQPLLNYLIALSYERGKIKFSEDTLINEIYKDMITSVYERSYAGHVLKPIENINEASFFKLFESIALSAWHGDGRTTTVKKIEETSKNSSLIKELKEGSEKGIIALLAAFYFRKSGQATDGNECFEFTHKSFGEYLIARKIVERLSWVVEKIEQIENNPDEMFNTKDIIKKFTSIFGEKTIDYYIFRFIQSEIKLQYTQEKINNLQILFIKLFNEILEKGIDLEKRGTIAEDIRRSKNIYKNLFMLLSAISSNTLKISCIKWQNDTNAAEIFTLIREPREEYQWVLSNLQLLDLSSQQLICLDLYGANLTGVNLTKADLEDAYLRGVALEGADLREVYLGGGNLEEANLEGANLEGAYLGRVNLKEAYLKGANLKETNLEDSDLTEASLEGASLRGGLLIGANLKEVSLKGANLKEANLKIADLTKADLEKANLEGANLEGANLKGANLKGVSFKMVNLKEGDLTRAKLTGANLAGARLAGADFTGTTGADFAGAINLDKAKNIPDNIKKKYCMYNN